MTFDSSANSIRKTNSLDSFWLLLTANRQFKAKTRLRGLPNALGIRAIGLVD